MTARVATRLSRWVAAALAVAVVVVLVVHLAGGDAAPLTPRTLAASLAAETGSAPGRCVHGRGTWMCAVPGTAATYLVTVVDDRCWRARLAGPAPGRPARAAGCVTG